VEAARAERRAARGRVRQARAGDLLATYSRRYLAEMRGPAAQAAVDELARRVADGETITLLCSSACADPRRCHRSLLAELVAERAEALSRRRA
jgi:uncharacterized protein YeaO (DUF488 family)